MAKFRLPFYKVLIKSGIADKLIREVPQPPIAGYSADISSENPDMVERMIDLSSDPGTLARQLGEFDRNGLAGYLGGSEGEQHAFPIFQGPENGRIFPPERGSGFGPSQGGECDRCGKPFKATQTKIIENLDGSLSTVHFYPCKDQRGPGQNKARRRTR